MLLGRPCLVNAKVTHDWLHILIQIKGNKIVWTIVVAKHLDKNTKWPKVLFCFNFMEGVTNKEDVILFAYSNLFMIKIITLPKPKLEITIIVVTKLDIDNDDITLDFPHTPLETFLLILFLLELRFKSWRFRTRHYWKMSNQKSQLKNCRSPIIGETKCAMATIVEQLLQEYIEVFAWTYKDLKGIPPHIIMHYMELDTTISPTC